MWVCWKHRTVKVAFHVLCCANGWLNDWFYVRVKLTINSLNINIIFNSYTILPLPQQMIHQLTRFTFPDCIVFRNKNHNIQIPSQSVEITARHEEHVEGEKLIFNQLVPLGPSITQIHSRIFPVFPSPPGLHTISLNSTNIKPKTTTSRVPSFTHARIKRFRSLVCFCVLCYRIGVTV